MGYLDSISPYELTINEQLQRDAIYNEQKATLDHYQGSIREYQTGQYHVCDLCRSHKLQAFFKRFNGNINGFEQEIQEEAFNLNVTQAEYNANAQAQDRAAGEVKF